MVSIFSINADLFEPRERARYQSYSSLVLMASGAIGPVLGGTMSDLFGWRSIFLVNVPIGFVVMAGLITMLPYRKPVRKPKIDYAGAVLLALTTTSIVLVADATELFGSLLAPQSLGHHRRRRACRDHLGGGRTARAGTDRADVAVSQSDFWHAARHFRAQRRRRHRHGQLFRALSCRQRPAFRPPWPVCSSSC